MATTIRNSSTDFYTINSREDGRTEVIDPKGYVVFCGSPEDAWKISQAKIYRAHFVLMPSTPHQLYRAILNNGRL